MLPSYCHSSARHWAEREDRALQRTDTIGWHMWGYTIFHSYKKQWCLLVFTCRPCHRRAPWTGAVVIHRDHTDIVNLAAHYALQVARCHIGQAFKAIAVFIHSSCSVVFGSTARLPRHSHRGLATVCLSDHTSRHTRCWKGKPQISYGFSLINYITNCLQIRELHLTLRTYLPWQVRLRGNWHRCQWRMSHSLCTPVHSPSWPSAGAVWCYKTSPRCCCLRSPWHSPLRCWMRPSRGSLTHVAQSTLACTLAGPQGTGQRGRQC